MLDTLIDKGAREQQVVEQEQEKGKCNGENKDQGLQQEVNSVALAVTAKRAGRSLRPANRQKLLPNLDLSPELSYNKAGS